jgi:hypothetical protein
MTTRIRLRDEGGQAIVVTAVFMVALIGAVGLTLDVGSWYREHRQAQSTADAAALAGAQALPDDPAQAFNLANEYGNDNGGGVAPTDGITFESKFSTNDTVTVKVRRTAPGFFSKLFSISSVQVGATASARAQIPDQALWAAPITVNKLHPFLTGVGCGKTSPCFGSTNPTTLPLGKTGAPGAFALLNLDQNDTTGTIGAKELAQWILKGFNQYLDIGQYFSDPGAKWNDNVIQDALHLRFGSELLFPVYDTLTGTGSNAEYHIIGWVGFHVTDTQASGTSGSISGWFTKVIWTGIQSNKNPNTPDFGVRSIALVK